MMQMMHRGGDCLTTNTAVALGFFDGVHLAHRAIFEETVRIARAQALTSVALTFSDSPKAQATLLTTPAERERQILQCGIDRVVMLAPTAELLAMTPEAFAQSLLVEKLQARAVVCGFNYRFGHGAAGHVETLRTLGDALGFSVTVIGELQCGGTTVSSSAIRSAVLSGDFAAAEGMLGRPFEVVGTIEHGKHLGRTLGFPTANLYPDARLVLPPRGVYVSEVMLDGVPLGRGVTNVGVNPTTDDGGMRIETYITDFAHDIYGHELRLHFLRFLRPEQKFPDIDALRAQIARDAAAAKQ